MLQRPALQPTRLLAHPIPSLHRTRHRRHSRLPFSFVSASSASGTFDNDEASAAAFVPPPPKATPTTSSKATSPTYVEQTARIKRLAEQLRTARQAIRDEEERQRVLAPFRVSAPRRGIVGNSRYARNLRKSVYDAANDPLRSPVLIFGEPGLQKTNIATLMHFGSANSKAPLVRLDCARLDDDASDLLGRGAKRGLMAWLPPDATIILDNVHKAPPAVIPLLQREVATASLCASIDEDDGSFDPTSTQEFEDQILLEIDNANTQDMNKIEAKLLQRAAEAPPTSPSAGIPQRIRCAFPRIIMTAEERVPSLEPYCNRVVKVPPLRVRPEDIPDLATYFLRTLAREQGLGPLSMTPEALRRLEAGTYPNNVTELESAVARAVSQTVKSDTSSSTSTTTSSTSSSTKKPRLIGEEVLWMANQPKDRLRVVNLLRTVPYLRDFLRSEWWPDKINFGFTKYAFAVIVAMLFVLPQDRDHNVALNVFWCYWWPGIFIVYPFLGRVWCAVCPFMIYGEIVQAWRKSTGAKLMKWPKDSLDRYGAWFLFALFALILVWEEVWDLPQNAALSSWLLLLITFGAMIGSFFYERRVWCRYLCPVGGMNGMFAKLAVTELRARQGVCSATCDTYGCYKGGPEVPPEGLATDGCPVYSHPAQLTDNRNCVLCMECLKACPHGSIEVRLRLPGAGIWSGEHEPMQAEVALMFLLLGAVYLHDVRFILQDFGVAAAQSTALLDDQLPHIALSFAILAVPGVIAWGVDKAWRLAAELTRPAEATAALRPVLSTGSTTSEAEQKAISLLQSAAGSYASQSANAPIIAPSKPFYHLAYGFLPMVWTATLAYYLPLLLLEGGHVLPVAMKTFYLEPPAWLPAPEANPAVVDFLQGGLLLFGAALSLGLTRRVAAQPWKVIVPHCLVIAVFTAELWNLMLR